MQKTGKKIVCKAAPIFACVKERQRDQAKVLERRQNWRVRLRRETSRALKNRFLEGKPNVSFFHLKSRKDTEKKNNTHHLKQKLFSATPKIHCG